jgi:hypothetical protein
VEEEDYGSVNERRRNFMKGAPQPPSKYDNTPLIHRNFQLLNSISVLSIFVSTAIEKQDTAFSISLLSLVSSTCSL